MANKAVVQLAWIPKESSRWSSLRKPFLQESLVPPASTADPSLCGLKGYSIGDHVLLWSQAGHDQTCNGRISSIPASVFTKVKESDRNSWQSLIDKADWRPKPDTALENHLTDTTCDTKICLLGNDICVVTKQSLFFRDLDYWLPSNDSNLISEDEVLVQAEEFCLEDDDDNDNCEVIRVNVKESEVPLNSILKKTPVCTAIVLNPSESVSKGNVKKVQFEVLTKAQETNKFDLPARYDALGRPTISEATLQGSRDLTPQVRSPMDEVLPDEGGYMAKQTRGGSYSRKFKKLSRSENRSALRHREHMMRLMSEWMYTAGMKRDGPDRVLIPHFESRYAARSTLIGWRELTVESPSFQFDQVYRGSNFYVATTACGGVYTWGSNQNGTLGLDSRVRDVPGPIGVMATADRDPRGLIMDDHSCIIQTSAGSRHTVVLSMNHGEKELYGWGCNRHGRLGNAVSVENVIAPTKLVLFAAEPNEEVKENQVPAMPNPPTNKRASKRRRGILKCLGVCLEGQFLQAVVDEFDATVAPPITIEPSNESINVVDVSSVVQVYCQDAFTFYLLEDGSILVGGVIIEADMAVGNFPLRKLQCSNLTFKRILETTGVKNMVAFVTTGDRVVIAKVPYSIPSGSVITPECILLHKNFLAFNAHHLSLIDTSGWGEEDDDIPYESSYMIILS